MRFSATPQTPGKSVEPDMSATSAAVQSPRPSRLAVLLAFTLAEASILAGPATFLSTSRFSIGPLIAAGGLWVVLAGIAWGRASLSQAGVPNGLARLGALLVYGLMAAAAIALLGFTLDGILIGLVASLIVWWRGLALGSSELNPQQARGLLWFGLLLAGVLNMLSANVERLMTLFIFALAALLAVQLSVRYAVAQYSYMSASALATPRWRRTTALIVLAVVGLAIFDAALLNSDVANTLVWLFITAIAVPLAFVLTVLLSALVQILPLDFLRQLLARLMALLNGMQQMTEQLPQQQPEINQQPPGAADPRLILFAIAAVVLVAIVLLLVRQVRLRRQSQADLNDTDAPVADVVDADGESEADARRNRSIFSRWFAAATIRLIYARMAAEAARRGAPRGPNQTPREFMPALAAAFPGAGDEVNTITGAYEAAHYGQLPDTLEKLDVIRRAWDRARKTDRPEKPPEKPPR